MSINPDNYSLSEFIAVTSLAKELETASRSMKVLDQGNSYKYDRRVNWTTYELTGHVADEVRRLFNDPDGVVKLYLKESFEDLQQWLSLRVNGEGQRFSGHYDRDDNLFEAAAVWLHAELKRKDYVDSGQSPALYDGAL